MKLLVPVLALGVLAVGVGSLTAQPRPAGDPPRLNLVGAHLSVDGERVLGPFSIQQGSFGYLYFYVPGRGLFTIGAAPFEGASRAGTFAGRRMEVSVGGTELRLQSSTAILGRATREAWVQHDPDFQLNVQGVMYGYGDHPSIAERWLEQFGGG